MRPVPRSFSELTPAWMTQALERSFPGAVISEVAFGDVVDGTNRRASASLRYAAGDGPARIFVKLHGTIANRLALLALGALTAEARLFGSGVTLPLQHALPHAAAFDSRRLRSAVVLEDVTLRGGTPNAATSPLTAAQARSGLTELARLHATQWERPLPPGLRFARQWRLHRSWAPVSAASLANGIRRLRLDGLGGSTRSGGDRKLVPERVSVALLERQFRASAALNADGPQTLLHGDPHLGNTYSLPGGQVGFYDWQLIRTGNWCHDVGYFMISSLDVATRREYERDLLDDYLAALREHGVSAPSASDASERYRAAPAYGLGAWLHTLSAGSFQPRSVCLATLERFAAAYDDLGTASSAALASPASAA